MHPNDQRRSLLYSLCLLLLLSLAACNDEPAASPQVRDRPTLEPKSLTPGAPGPDSIAAAPRETATLAPTRTPVASPTIIPSPTVTLPPTNRMEAAREADLIGDWPRAIALYDSLRDDATFGAEALFYLGDLHQRDDRLVEAALAWQESLERDPDGPFAAPIRYRLARGFATISQHQTAIELLEQVDTATDDADDLVAQRLAEAHSALGRKEAIVEEWQRIYDFPMAERVTRALTARQIGDWYAGEERWEEALIWYERTLDLSQVPEFRAELLGIMADFALELEDEPRARELWQTIVEEHPDTPQALFAAEDLKSAGEELTHYELGELYLANERWDVAARAFWRSLEEADRAEAHHQAALALEGAGDFREAQDEWQKLLDSHPEARTLHDDALLNVGRMQARLGNLDAALGTWQQVATRYPTGDAAPAALWERAVTLRDRQGEPVRAAGAFEVLAARYPNDEQASLALWEAGLLRYRAGNWTRAQDDWASLSERDLERPARALFWAGKAAASGGDVVTARAFWEQANRRGGADYYALRSAALIQGARWEPRAGSDWTRPDAASVDWLIERARLPADANLHALPDEPLLRRGHLLLLMGERDAAFDSFLAAVRAHRENPQALWALAHHFRDEHLPLYSIYSAQRLMELLNYTPLTAPLPLAQLVYPIRFDEQLRAVAGERGFDPLFFAALIYQESQWEPRARSHAAARGLTQVIPDTGSWIAQQLGDTSYRYRDLDRPLVALRYGAFYLDASLDMFDDNPFYALAGYNGGPGNAQRWRAPDDDLFMENIAFRETRNYVELIYEHWHAYQRIYRAGDGL
jgi:soluble lytic murein transglycosylase